MLKFSGMVIIGILSWLVGKNGQAKSLECNSHQSYCLVRDKNLTVGDPVGFFNSGKELIAVGKVRRTLGPKRRIEITKRMGKINRGYRIARLDTTSMVSLSKDYEIYHRPNRINAGGELSMVRLGMGDGAPGFAATAFADYGWKKGIHFSGKLEYLNVSGEVNGGFFAPKINTHASLSAFTVAPGLAYHINKNKKWSARVGLNLGIAYVMGEADGSDKLFPIYVRNIDQGAGLYSSVGGSIFHRISEWKIGAGAKYFRLHEANSYSLSLLASMPIK